MKKLNLLKLTPVYQFPTTPVAKKGKNNGTDPDLGTILATYTIPM